MSERWKAWVLGGFLLGLVGCSPGASDDEPLGRSQEAVQILNATFPSNSQGFLYVDDTFGTSRPTNASGVWSNGQLHVTLNYTTSTLPKSGGWRYTFPGPGVTTIAFDWVMRRANFESTECSEVRVTVDGTAYGSGSNAYVSRSCATGTSVTTSGRFTFTTPSLASGNHTLTIGGWLSSSNVTSESLNVDIDNVTIDVVAPASCGDQSCNGSETCTTCPGDCGACPPAPQPFLESGGTVVMEAESFSTNTSQAGKSWTSVTDANASGNVAYQATPNTGTAVNTGYVTGSPRLNFPVSFSQTGTYYVWIRGRDPDVPYASASDSVHAGIDNTAPASADRIGSFSSAFGWMRATLDGANASINVTTAGTHTINVWMREDGFVIDKLLLTNDDVFTPTGLGPTQSPRVGASGCGDGTCGTGETCSSCVVDCCGLGSRPSNTTCLAPAAPGTGYGFNRVWPAITFTEPVGLAQAPSDNDTFFVVQKTGAVRALSRSATMASQVRTFLNLEGVVDTGGPPNAGGEGGLLGIAFHPNYGTGNNWEVYVSYTTDLAVPNTVFMHRVSRFRSLDSGQTLATSTQQVLIEHPKTKTNHNAGDIAFGPDGYLYIAFGDDAYQDPTRALMAADVNQRYGKVLRIDVNAPTYAIPPNNPFSGGTGIQREVFAYGFRNPWRMSFDKSNGSLYLADVGEDTWEEIDLVTSGAFYGWPHREADQCRPSGNCSLSYTSPREAYNHNGAPKSITGGFVYRGTALPDLAGQYVYGDYLTGEVWAYDGIADSSVIIDPLGGTLSSFGQENSGELYAVRFSTGTIEKLEAAGPPGGSYPASLGNTGCFSTATPTQVSAGVIPYSLALPFWSDGTLKERFLALPDGTTMTVASNGDFTLPPGAVTIKNFRHQGQLFETRFFVRHTDGSYSGYTYQWNDQQTLATLVGASGATRMLPGLNWTYPSRGACLTCHTEAAGRSLGLETRQINIDASYPSTGRTANQLATLGGIGMLSGNLASLAPFAALENTSVPIQDRARAYLHVNCSNCHRPGGPGRGPMDARFDVPFADMRICNEPPTLGDLGVPGAMHLTPGNNQTSLIWLRMSQRQANFMPPLASTLVDTVGAQRLEEWIDGITSCPAPTGPAPCNVAGNEVTNCSFDSVVSPWDQRDNGVVGSASVVGGELRIDVTTAGANNWEPQVVQNVGSIAAGTYEIEFSARANANRDMVINLGKDGPTYESRCERTVSLTTTTQHFSLTCSVVAEPNMKLDFNVGAAGTSVVFLDNVYFGVPR